MIDTNFIIYSALIVLLGIGGVYYFFYRREKKELAKLAQNSPAATTTSVTETPSISGTATTQLKLQAYERLVILAERIALPNLIARMSQPGMAKTDMQQLLTGTIKQEYEYNLSQQIYVSNEAWDAIRNLKEQNIHLINQVAIILPADASGAELCKKVIEVVMSQPHGSMHSLVQEALSYEAKKLI